jgi:hypothetical protein
MVILFFALFSIWILICAHLFASNEIKSLMRNLFGGAADFVRLSWSIFSIIFAISLIYSCLIFLIWISLFIYSKSKILMANLKEDMQENIFPREKNLEAPEAIFGGIRAIPENLEDDPLWKRLKEDIDRGKKKEA